MSEPETPKLGEEVTREQARELLAPYKGKKGLYRRELGDYGEYLAWMASERSPTRAMELFGYVSAGNISSRWRTLGLIPEKYDAGRTVRNDSQEIDHAPIEELAAGAGDLAPVAADLLEYLRKQSKRGPIQLEAVCNEFDLSPSRARQCLQDLRDEHYDVVDDLDAQVYLQTTPGLRPTYTPPNLWDQNPLKLGLVSDTHMGIAPEWAAEEELHVTYQRFADRGVEDVLHMGDITHGINSRHPALRYEMADGVVGADDQKQYVIEHYPQVEGIKTYFITGSHDLWVYTTSGYDIGKGIADEREDMVYLGQESSDFKVGPEKQTKIRLFHPGGGQAYAISYQPQKFVEAMVGGDKPHLFLLGHYHRYLQFRPRNVLTMCLPGFMWNSPFWKRTGKEPEVGAIYLELDLEAEGGIAGWRTEVWPYYYTPSASEL